MSLLLLSFPFSGFDPSVKIKIEKYIIYIDIAKIVKLFK